MERHLSDLIPYKQLASYSLYPTLGNSSNGSGASSSSSSSSNHPSRQTRRRSHDHESHHSQRGSGSDNSSKRSPRSYLRRKRRNFERSEPSASPHPHRLARRVALLATSTPVGKRTTTDRRRRSFRRNSCLRRAMRLRVRLGVRKEHSRPLNCSSSFSAKMGCYQSNIIAYKLLSCRLHQTLGNSSSGSDVCSSSSHRIHMTRRRSHNHDLHQSLRGTHSLYQNERESSSGRSSQCSQ